MAGNCSEGKWKQQPGSKQEEENEEEEEEEEAEALSLCDLPVSLTKEDENQLLAMGEEEEDKEQYRVAESTNQEEFDFGRWGGSGSLSIISEMCAAEDIFYKGQILPLRHSFSSTSDKGLINYTTRRDSLIPAVNRNRSCSSPVSLNLSQSASRSEPMDRGLLGGFNSFSSRSSSTSSRSTAQYSSSSTITTGSNIPTKRKAINQFHITHPSPKPHVIRHTSVSSAASVGNSSTFSRNRKSSVWDFFRLGLVRTPGIHELQELKVRGSVSRNSSSGSSSVSTGNSNLNSSIKNSASLCSGKIHSGGTEVREKEVGKNKKQGFFDKRGGLSGCSCTIGAVKPVPLNNAIIKRGDDTNGKSGRGAGVVEKQQELKMIKQRRKKEEEEKEKTVERLKEKEGGKQELSRQRTFEWIKELSHGSYTDNETEG